MLHKNCHIIIVILVYAVLEWILILLLLLNSFFSNLITEFANFFGLKPPCTWCSKLHHTPVCENVCEKHGNEISKLSYCFNHKRLSKSKNLCGDCSFSRPVENGKINEISSFFKWASENGEENRCCCCDEILSIKIQSLVFNPSWDVLDNCIHKKDSIDANEKTDLFEDYCNSPSDFVCDANEDDESVYITDMLLQNADYIDSDSFICIELIDTSSSVASQKALANSSDDIDTNNRTCSRRDEDIEKCRQIFSGATPSRPEEEEEEDNFPDIQVEEKRHSPDGLHKKLIMFEKMGSGPEDFSDVREIIDMQIDDDSLTKEHLKITLKAQQKALNALYEELEEERKAAAIAANETMAMITKLQEEKANIQTEALQYQRMMEEQAEYDQEALQLLNDLMIKREKEKQELEKELDFYRDNVLDYEARENESGKSENSSTFSGHGRINVDVLEDSESLAEFDEERLSILEELKVLEAKLFSLHDHDHDETQLSENVESVECLITSSDDRDGKSNFERKTIELMAKKLLPLLDATDSEISQHLRDFEIVVLEHSFMGDRRPSSAAAAAFSFRFWPGRRTPPATTNSAPTTALAVIQTPPPPATTNPAPTTTPTAESQATSRQSTTSTTTPTDPKPNPTTPSPSDVQTASQPATTTLTSPEDEPKNSSPPSSTKSPPSRRTAQSRSPPQPSSPAKSPSRVAPQARSIRSSSPSQMGSKTPTTPQRTPQPRSPSRLNSRSPKQTSPNSSLKDTHPTSPSKESRETNQDISTSLEAQTLASNEKDPKPVMPSMVKSQQETQLKAEVKPDSVDDFNGVDDGTNASKSSKLGTTTTTTQSPDKPTPTEKLDASSINGGNEPLEAMPEEKKDVKEVLQATKTEVTKKEVNDFLAPKSGSEEPIIEVRDFKKTRRGTHSKSVRASGEHVSLNKDIMDDISKIVNKTAIGGTRNAIYDRHVSIITLAGENRGASMQMGYNSSKGVHIHRGYKIKPDENAEATTDGEGSFKGKQSEDAKATEDQPTEAYVNNNAQGINNSIVFNSSIAERNPGVHMAVTHVPKEPIRSTEKTSPLETRKAEFNMSRARNLHMSPR
ncbi:hypothetical protein DH2020_013776 [Rehmannia glutinosa]|uniref:GTD-binding domain-containing protein n=1 Tax=Rehmannia glutinosa TaxID=99300 RepID=A0ABR0X6C0_REHGL